MDYVVHAVTPDGEAIFIAVSDRNEALAAANEWVDEGRLGVKIMGHGRTYTKEQFPLTIMKE